MKNQLLKIALITFPDRNWEIIKSCCKTRSGVYGFICNVNESYYIGSAVDLFDRLRDYHQPWYLKNHANDLIVRAINKYGMENFTVVILEFTEADNTVEAEQVWIDRYKPKYNLLKKAGSSLGYKHLEEDRLKISEAMKGKLRSQEVPDEISIRQTGRSNFFMANRIQNNRKVLCAPQD